MAFATGLGTFGVFGSVSSLRLTTAGIMSGRASIELFDVAPPNIAFGKATLYKIYTTANSPYSVATFGTMRVSSVAVLTPGFQAALSIKLVTPAISMSQISANLLTNGTFTPAQFGVPVTIQGPPSGLTIPFNSIGLATTIAASGSATSAVIPSFYYPHLVIGLTSTQAGALNVQRYIDVAGTVAQGSALTAALSANTAATLDNADGKGFGSFTVQVTNIGTVSGTLSAVALLLLAR